MPRKRGSATADRAPAGDMAAVSRGALRLARVAAQLSQEQLAELAGVTRQAVAGIEAGRFDPSLPVAMRLARALGATVEALFGDPAAPVVRQARWVDAVPGGSAPGTGATEPGTRVDVASVGGTDWAFRRDGPASSALGFQVAGGVVVSGDRTEEREAPVGSATDPAPDGGKPSVATEPVEVALLRPLVPTVVVAGCDPALPLLAAPLAALSPPVRLLWWPCSSRRALALAVAGAVHAAGVHRQADGRGLPAAGRRSLVDGAVVVAFASWDEGLALHPSVADRVGDVADLARLGLAVANRERGSEARAVLQRECRRHGIRPMSLAGWDLALPGHLPVAAAVSAGLVDGGITTGPAAAAHGLAFRPLVTERFDLVVPRIRLADPEVRALLAALGGAELRDQLGAIPGYDPAACGTVVEAVTASAR